MTYRPERLSADPRRILAKLAKTTTEFVRYTEYANHAIRNFWNAHQCRVGAAKRARMKRDIGALLNAVEKITGPAMLASVRADTAKVIEETANFPKEIEWPGTAARLWGITPGRSRIRRDVLGCG
jgi:hypothetical protein